MAYSTMGAGPLAGGAGVSPSADHRRAVRGVAVEVVVEIEDRPPGVETDAENDTTTDVGTARSPTRDRPRVGPDAVPTGYSAAVMSLQAFITTLLIEGWAWMRVFARSSTVAPYRIAGATSWISIEASWPMM